MKKKMKRSIRDFGRIETETNFETGVDRAVIFPIEEVPVVKEAVVHPEHYNSGNIEVWDYIIDQGLSYCLGDAVKYISRAGKKDPTTAVQDLKKAINFINREIQRIETGA